MVDGLGRRSREEQPSVFVIEAADIALGLRKRIELGGRPVVQLVVSRPRVRAARPKIAFYEARVVEHPLPEIVEELRSLESVRLFPAAVVEKADCGNLPIGAVPVGCTELDTGIANQTLRR